MYELPIPRLPRNAAPLQLEGSLQRVNLFFEELHDFALAAIEPDSTRPLTAALFCLHAHVECADLKIANVPEAFMHTFEHAGAIVAPLIVIIAPNETTGGRPVFVFDRMKKVFSMTFNLPLRPPEPEKKQPDTDRCGEPAIKCSTQ